MDFPCKVIYWFSNVFLIRHYITCLYKLIQFDSWNSFIFQTLVYTPERYRFNIFDISNRPTVKSYSLLFKCFLKSTLFRVFTQIVSVDSWNSFIFQTLVYTPERYRFNIFDISYRTTVKSYSLLFKCFLKMTLFHVFTQNVPV